jgi:hypothetical protein
MDIKRISGIFTDLQQSLCCASPLTWRFSHVYKPTSEWFYLSINRIKKRNTSSTVIFNTSRNGFSFVSIFQRFSVKQLLHRFIYKRIGQKFISIVLNLHSLQRPPFTLKLNRPALDHFQGS